MASPVIITISGNLDEQPNVDDPTASVSFVRKWWASGSDGTVLEPGVQTVVVDANGQFSIEVASNNDPAWQYFGPSGDVSYEVVVKTSVDGSGVTYRYRAVVPYNAPGAAMGLPVDAGGVVTAPGVWAAVNHTHTDLVTDLELAEALDALESAGVISVNCETGAVTLNAVDVGAEPAGAVSGLAATVTTALAGKSDTTHDHDGRYYTETESDTLLAGKAASGHTHDTRYYTETEADAALALKAPLASPTFTGTPALPTGTTGVTQTAGNNTTALATTAFVTTADALKANLASPTFTGTPAAPTAGAGTSTTQLATTAFVTTADNLKAPLASPTFTGTPAAPTAAVATNTTQLATTAFVQAVVAALAALKLDKASPVILDDTFTVQKSDGTAGFRFRATGSAADMDLRGEVVVSNFAGPGWTGQTAVMRWRNTGTTLAGLTEFGDTVYGGAQWVSGANGSALFNFQATGLDPLRPRGRKTTTGAPTTGTWAVGDAIMDSAKVWWYCTVAGTPGTWV